MPLLFDMIEDGLQTAGFMMPLLGKSVASGPTKETNRGCQAAS